VLFGPELEAIAVARDIRVLFLVGPRARPGSWLPRQYAGPDDVAALRRLVPGIAAAEVYVCGPVPWAESVTAAARAAGVPSRRIHCERFSW
jgi:ferredoxin-NADP reductase